MTEGQQIAAIQLGYAGRGIHEDPLGSNHDQGGPIDKAEAFWHLSGLAYCAMGVSQGYRDAGVNDAGVISPSTAIMCERADAQKLWLAPGARVPPGAILILCGIHTETAIDQRANGWIDAVGWNVSDGVYKTVRQLAGGWRCIVPPDIYKGTPQAITMYGFDDLTLKPHRAGPWHDMAARDGAASNYLAHNQGQRVRKLRVPGPNQFAFDIISPGAGQWHFGPWSSQTGRDAQMHDYSNAHPGHPLRPWSQPITPQQGGALTGGKKVT